MKQELQRPWSVGGEMTQLRILLFPLAVGAAAVAGFVAGQLERGAPACAPAQAPSSLQASPPVKPLAPRRQEPGLIVPVRGVSGDAISDSWGEPRASGGHQGVDIVAPYGAEVLAAADGSIAKFFDSAPGGVTIYQYDESRRHVFYYAHLSGRASGLAEGDAVRQGDVIGYVGMSGNAATPHLHFEIQKLTEPGRWWRADSLNPYPYLSGGAELG